jgi:hypothetical protein
MVPDDKPAARRLEAHAPFDGKLIANVETADGAVVEPALTTAHALYRNREAWFAPAERIAISRREEAAARLPGVAHQPICTDLLAADAWRA